MDKDYKNGKMEMNMMEFGSMISNVEKDVSNIQTVMFIKVCGRKDNIMVKEHLNKKMELCIKVTGEKE